MTGTENTPLITVLMAVHNGAAYIAEAIDALLVQCENNFELIIIDDASTDDTVTLISAYTDTRIQLLQLKSRSGPAVALNTGLAIARGRYIAINDADDVSLPQRLAKQKTYLQNHPHVLAVGSSVQTCHLTTDRPAAIWKTPTDWARLLFRLHFHCPVVHSTLMIRREALSQIDGYRDHAALDFEMLLQLSWLGAITTIEECLVIYRLHPESHSQLHAQQVSHDACHALQTHWARRLGTSLPFPVIKALFHWGNLSVVTDTLSAIQAVWRLAIHLSKCREFSIIDRLVIIQEALRRTVIMSMMVLGQPLLRHGAIRKLTRRFSGMPLGYLNKQELLRFLFRRERAQ